jgi:hypothetical protein
MKELKKNKALVSTSIPNITRLFGMTAKQNEETSNAFNSYTFRRLSVFCVGMVRGWPFSQSLLQVASDKGFGGRPRWRVMFTPWQRTWQAQERRQECYYHAVCLGLNPLLSAGSDSYCCVGATRVECQSCNVAVFVDSKPNRSLLALVRIKKNIYYCSHVWFK